MGASAVVSLRRAVERSPAVGQTDEVLVARVRAGDDGAFEAIYDRYARGVLAFCVHMLGSREEAEDALQLTFVSAYRGLRRSPNEIALRPWLYTIARNRCLSELRVRREAVDGEGVVAARPSVEGLADQVQRRQDLRELVEDMQRLPEDQRAALVLFEMGDHSHKEIAAVLGIRPDKVKALIFQAREGLVRSRRARERPCMEIREVLATAEARVLPRSTARAHIDRCPSCAAFEDEVVRQRASLALILPVVVSAELKTAVLSAGFGGAAGVGAAAAGGTGAAATAAVAGAQSVTVVASGVVAAATLGLGGVDATRLMAKLLTAAAIATGAAAPSYGNPQSPAGQPAASLTAPASAMTQVTAPRSAATAPVISPLNGTSRAPGVPPSAFQQPGSTAAGQPAGSGATASGPSPARLVVPGQSSSAPGSAQGTQTGAASSPAAPPDTAGAGGSPSAPGQSGAAPSASPGNSGAANGNGQASSPSGQSGTTQSGPSSSPPDQSGTTQSGPSSSPPGRSGAARGNGPPSSPPGQSGAARGNGPPSSPPGQSGAAQNGQPTSSPGNSGTAPGGGPPPGQSGSAPGGPPGTSGPSSDPAGSSSPGKSGSAPGHAGASNGQGAPPAKKP